MRMDGGRLRSVPDDMYIQVDGYISTGKLDYRQGSISNLASDLDVSAP